MKQRLGTAAIALCLNAIAMTSACAETSLNLTELSKQSANLQALYPSGSLLTEAQAELALTQTKQVQQALQGWALQAETECYERFFVYACLQDVRQTRRLHSDQLQAIILDAKATQRRLQLAQRDQELQEKNKQP